MVRRLVAQLVRVVVVVALCAVSVGAAAPAVAQMGGMNVGVENAISRASVKAYARTLGLDPAQVEVIENLHDAYRKDYEGITAGMRDEIGKLQEDLGETYDMKAFQRGVVQAAKRMTEKQKALEVSFLGDLKLTLTPDQQEIWPVVERQRRRDKYMRVPMVAGAGADLVRIVDQVKARAADEAEFRDLLGRYEADLDKHMIAMARVYEELEAKLFDSTADLNDLGRLQNLFKECYPVSRDVRETNREYARKLSALLEEPSRTKFMEEYRVRAHPRIYKPVHVLRMIEGAEKLTDLGGAARAELAELKAAFLREVEPLNERWARAVEERDDIGGGLMAVMMASAQNGAAELNKDANAAREARKELEARTRERLSRLLTQEQLDQLPRGSGESNQTPFIDIMPDYDE